MSLSPEQNAAINHIATTSEIDQDQLEKITASAEKANEENQNPTLAIARQAVETAFNPATTAELQRRVAVEQGIANNPDLDETQAQAILAAQGLVDKVPK